jgi:hypothetical protein
VTLSVHVHSNFGVVDINALLDVMLSLVDLLVFS